MAVQLYFTNRNKKRIRIGLSPNGKAVGFNHVVEGSIPSWHIIKLRHFALKMKKRRDFGG